MDALSTDEIAEMKIHEVLRLVIPDQEVSELADLLHIPPQTLYKWRLDPDLFKPDGKEKKNDPNGRRGIGHHFNMFVLRLNGRFPAGAQFLLRWQNLQLAKAQAIQGHQQALAILQIADEADAILDKFQALEGEVRAWKARIIAAAGSAPGKT
jgi:hypothetical protein